MTLSLIAALTRNRVIGKNNDLPWRLPNDMKHFMQTTQGHCVVMGRKNYESIPHKFRPLPQRTNIVVTRQKDYTANGCVVVHSLEEAIQVASEKNEHEVFIIGGAEIYTQALPKVHRLYLTEIDAVIDGDTFFPEVNATLFKEVSRKHHTTDSQHAYAFDFVVYERA